MMGKASKPPAGRLRWPIILVAAVTALLLQATPILGWGVTGHEIVATIAQTQLHPDVRAHLCNILPPENTAYRSFYPRPAEGNGPHQHCHLAPLAAWADRVRNQYPWASHLHYVNPVQDDPPKHCTYGEFGWQDHGTGNVLEAMVNYTSQLKTASGYQRDLALRFLTHFMGDTHQPLHLTGRARGGNDIPVHFNGRYARLHTVWDTLLLNDQIRDLANHTTPLPSARIESALLGRTYDAYVRWILSEGLGQAQGANSEPGWWHREAASWTECPERSQSADKQKRHTRWLRAVTPNSSLLAQRIYATIFRNVPAQAFEVEDPSNVDDTDLPVCPYAWTKSMHGLVCSYAFAEPVPPPGQDHGGPLAELSVPQYAGRIADDKILHRQLARAGIRLAAVLNTLLLPEAQKMLGSSEVDQVGIEMQSVQVSRWHMAADSDDGKRHGKHGGHHTGSGPNKQSPIFSLIKVTAASIAEVVILSSIGYILARQGVLDKRTQTKINKVNVSFFTPALLFSKVAFSLDPGRLAELIIVPAGFVIITVVSGLSAMLLSWMARLSRSQRNFSIACAITPNSNSLPVALMQSLVVTVPQLHWEEDGEPEDTVNGMLGRALTYLVLFSTLGMFLRWSLASQLLSTMEEAEDEMDEEPVTGMPTAPPTGQLIDHEDSQSQPQRDSADGSGTAKSMPHINIRRTTEDGGGLETVARAHRRPTAWARSFPNSPDDSDDERDVSEQSDGMSSSRQQQRSCLSSTRKAYSKLIVKPFKAVTAFMTMPLYAALISLIVALIPPLQSLIGSIEPLVGALETAGACSIPLTMVVLGAYFYDESATTPKQSNGTAQQGPSTTGSEGSSEAAGWQQDNENMGSNQATLVNTGQTKRKSLPFIRSPWKSGSTSGVASRNGSVGLADNEAGQMESAAPSGMATPLSDGAHGGTNSWGLMPAWLSSNGSQLSVDQRKEKHRRAMERRTIIVSVASRMVLTPILLLPLLAWYAIATRYNVVDDPVFICSACLLIGSPPALTLAQITSQSAKGSNSSFERLISKTIFVSYAILATPTTIVLVLTALLIAENDH